MEFYNKNNKLYCILIFIPALMRCLIIDSTQLEAALYIWVLMNAPVNN